MANQRNKRSGADTVPLVLFILSLCVFSAAGGMLIWATQSFPYAIITNALTELEKLFPSDSAVDDEVKQALGQSNLNRIRYRDYGTKVRDRERVGPGSTILTTFWKESGWKPGVRLVDIDGNTLHHWDVTARKIWPLKDFPLGTYVHGSYLFPNGDIVVNVEYAGLARLNACSEVVWASNFDSHHSVFRDHDGNFWVAGYELVEDDSPRAALFPPIKPPFSEETLLRVSPDGELLQRISLLEALYESPWRHLLWHYNRIREPGKLDILHLNDVEVLPPGLAQEYPSLEAGDIVVSSRSLSFIAVLSVSGGIKWLLPGVFTVQHDPDFEGDGWITVFDNRDDWSMHKGSFLGGSQIRAVNPATNEVRDVYNSGIDGEIFYTRAGGKHQLLANGNRLITEAKAGRVFEVTPQGTTVWEWIAEPYNEKRVFDVLEGSRYADITAETTAAWACNEAR